MKKQKFIKGEKARLIVYLPETKDVEIIEQSKYRVDTKIKSGDDEYWVKTTRLRKILNEGILSEA